jgi:hypothetical protein
MPEAAMSKPEKSNPTKTATRKHFAKAFKRFIFFLNN